MNILKKITLVFALFGFFLVFSINSSTIADRNKKVESAKFWKKVFLQRVNSFDYYSEEIDSLISRIHNDLEIFREETVIYDTKYHQLKFILSNVIDNPYETRLIINEMNNLYSSYSSLYNQIKTLDFTADTYIKTLDDMEADVDYLAEKQFNSSDVVAAAIRLGFDICILKCQLKLEKKRMRESLSSMKIQIDKLTSLNKFVNDSLARQMKLYFLIPGMSILDIDWEHLTYYSFKRWLYTLPISLKERMPDSNDEFLALVVVLSIVIFLYLFFYYYIFSNKTKIKENNYWAYKKLKNALLTFFVFLGLLSTSTILVFPETIIFYRLAVIFFGCFSWYFTMGMKKISRPGEGSDNYLFGFLILFVAGLILQILSFNYVMFALVWPLLLILVFLLVTIENYRLHYKRNGFTYLVFTVFLFALIILSFKGYIYLSIFISMITFLVLVTFRMGLGIIWILKRFLEKNKGIGSLQKAFIAGIGIPLIWLSVFVFLFLWTSIQISSNAFILFKYLYNLELIFAEYNLKIFKILILIFLFFVFNSFLKNFKNYLKLSPFAKRTKRQDIIPTLKNLSVYVSWSIYLIIVLFVFKVNITSILVVVGGLSVGIGFGLQHIINNFISGIIIMFGKTCRAGDIIELDGKWATVVKTDIRTTVIKTFDNCIITVPNSILIDQVLYNWTSNNDLVRRDISVGVNYNSDVNKVTELLLKIAGECKEISRMPEPVVLFSEFGESALVFILRFWLEEIDNSIVVPSKLRYVIFEQFNKEGIVIAYPQIDIHLKNIPESSFKKVIKGGSE